jgi:hypothetical protein
LASQRQYDHGRQRRKKPCSGASTTAEAKEKAFFPERGSSLPAVAFLTFVALAE